MLEAAAKNLWLLLTLVIPGLFTYGAWRALLLLEPSTRLPAEALSKMDSSAITATSVIIAIALLQQAFAIAIEAVCAHISGIMKPNWPNIYALFCERFALQSEGKLDENATRIVGNFFLSVNISVGLVLLLFFFMNYESMSITHWIPKGILVLLVIVVISAIFRMLNAKWAIEACKKKTTQIDQEGEEL